MLEVARRIMSPFSKDLRIQITVLVGYLGDCDVVLVLELMLEFLELAARTALSLSLNYVGLWKSSRRTREEIRTYVQQTCASLLKSILFRLQMW